jgi:hypothetical protein
LRIKAKAKEKNIIRRDSVIERIVVITNNPMSKDGFSDKYTVNYIEGGVMEVFKKVRDQIHCGHKILTHPLMSSIKPNETPYRTVLITEKKLPNIDMDSLDIIENAIMTTEKFIRDFNIPSWSESVLKDFQLIDYDLIFHALN